MSSITVDTATPDILDAINRWHEFMRGQQPDALDELLHDGVNGGAPS